FYSTESVRREIESHSLVEPSRLVHAPPGVAPEFRADATETASARTDPFMLHVGSCIPRKRVDVAIDLLAKLRASVAKDIRLVKVGGDWTAAHQQQIERLGVRSAITHPTGIDR